MFRRGSSKVASPKPKGKSRDENKSPQKSRSRDENTAPGDAAPEGRPAPVKRASLRDIYDGHKMNQEEMKKRHDMLGYDPIDKLLQSERLASNDAKSA